MNSLTIEQKELIKDGDQLLSWIKDHPKDGFSDYSFVVAPFAKAYEGFLKGFFLRHHLITEGNYSSDRFRVGKVLNPALQHKKWSVYRKLEEMGETGVKVAQRLWQAWKQGRNLIFHYFPHNYQKLTLPEAEERINGILAAMREAEILL